jgi:hypothetical protein
LRSTDVSRERANSLPRPSRKRLRVTRRATPQRIPVFPELASTIIDRCDKSQSVRSDSGKLWLTSHDAPAIENGVPLLAEARTLIASFQTMVPAGHRPSGARHT